MPDFVWKQGDTGPAITDVLTFTDGTTQFLQGATVQLRLRSLLNAALTTLTGQVIVETLSGAVIYEPTAADTNQAVGNYIAEWVVTTATREILTFPTDGYMWGRIEPNAATAPQLIVSLTDVKEHLNIDRADRSRDTRLLNLIQVVTPLIESQIGPIAPRIYEEWWDGGSNVLSVVRQPTSGFGATPVLKLMAASEYRGPIEYPLALIASPAFGSIYSVFFNADTGSLTRRTAGGRTIAFMPGREQVHIFYQTGLASTPPNVWFAALECVRVAWEWTRQVGRGSTAPGDFMEVGPQLEQNLSRIVRMHLMPQKRYPAIA